jgi:lysophospholipase L1-like esterase
MMRQAHLAVEPNMKARARFVTALFLYGLAVSALWAAPAAGQTWVSAWGGRGPLSTTITTSSTFKDPVPNLSGRTLRVMTHLTAGGSQLRVRLSQRFTSTPLSVAAAHVGIRASGNGTGIVMGSDRTLTFHGASSVTVPAGSDVWSDPVSLAVGGGKDLAISVYVPGSFTPTTEGGRAQIKSSYYLSGNQVASVSFPFALATRQVFLVYEVQVLAPGRAATIVALGDSITEGACSSVDANGDWPDLLSAKLPALPDGTNVAVFNAGIGSGRFASSDGAGLRGLTRLDEILTLPNVNWVMVLMGVNDISYEHVDAAFLEDAYAQAILKAHAAGKQIVGVPILPFGHSTKDVGNNKQVAQATNAWIRAHDKRSGVAEPSYDAIVDFESAIKDPNDPGWALSRSLTCDGVHPNQAGYNAIARSIPANVFN